MNANQQIFKLKKKKESNPNICKSEFNFFGAFFLQYNIFFENKTSYFREIQHSKKKKGVCINTKAKQNKKDE